MLSDPARLERWGHSAQRRAHDQFLVFGQLRAWGRLLDSMTSRRSGAERAPAAS
jgi:hypothetical protein